MRFPALLLASLLLATNQLPAAPTTLEVLARWMTGAFSNTDQARGDQNFRDMTLHVAPVWTDRADGPWLYSEQSLTDAPDHPYRQRLYQLSARGDDAVEVRIFELPDPVAATGAWKTPALLANLTPASLTPQPACTLVLHVLPDGSYKGGTEGKGCPNTLRGASYATSELTVTEKQVIAWDRGYNANGAQVWGSDRGGYLFKRVE